MFITLPRIPILDGWRAVSILLVLGGHLLPLGPSRFGLNGAIAASGMAIFFTLSGFLIASMLLANQDVPRFLTRRLLRILPLAWVAMLVLIILNNTSWSVAISNLLFVSNLPPHPLMNGGGHLWSLCVEVQFYAVIAIMVALGGKRALYLIPALALSVTALRVFTGTTMSITTWFRVDEILAGACLALVVHHYPKVRVPAFATVLLAPLIVAAAYPTPVAYLRPYLAAAAVGTSIYAAPGLMSALFTSRLAGWIAEISYGLYVLHGVLVDTWLGSGDKLVKYVKRPLLFIVTFLFAHLSFKYFERPIQKLGQRRTTAVNRAT
ncbi:acyltransferase [Sphingomonas piscis]|uniref:Acyltransferase n=1 Tax=Sphingomonas piscis TaxID=2714943 RepID=A0A6G7YQU6_9SPHN|nr:acyltransferase [Sphingomonas piscis]QIK79109.1 acyltransferase [Sphingomonas piscis]